MLGQKTGQIRAVAKGIRRTSSRFGARLSPFNLVDVQCHRGRGLHTIVQAETISAYSAMLTADYAAFTNAKLVVETAQKITEDSEDTDPEQFRLLHGALHSLANRAHPAPLVGAAYLLRSLGLEGWRPELGRCVSCGKHSGLSYFSASSGGALCEGCVSADSVKSEESVLSLMDALASSNWKATRDAPTESWTMAQELAGSWTQWHLEQKLKALPFAAARAV